MTTARKAPDRYAPPKLRDKTPARAPRLTDPMWSATAHGMLRGLYYIQHHNAVPRAIPPPPLRGAAPPPTPAQADARARHAVIMSAWHVLPDAQKLQFSITGLGQCMLGVNWYYHQWIAQDITPPDQPTP